MDARWTLSALAALAVSCSFEVPDGGARFRCAGGDCPLGFECVEQVCLAVGVAADAATDAPLLDAGLPPDARLEVRSCEEQYGDVADFAACNEHGDRCEFFGSASGGTCTELCAARGGDCLRGYDATNGVPCEFGPEDGCDAPHDHLICSCTLTPEPTD